ncbi:MAG: alpha/beta hydrolase [Acidobacteria bacterium]|nr:alpha/beta hydrolase [Acidobacteriota bacterium]
MTEGIFNGVKLHYIERGSGNETVLFLHGLLWDTRLYEPQYEALKDRYRCVAFDFRGQGQSEVTMTGFDMDTLYEDCVAFIETLGIGACHVVGLSMGGFVAMRLAARRPDLVKSLILLETSCEVEPKVVSYRMLNFIARWFGFGPVINRVMPIMFGKTFMSDPEREALRKELAQRIMNNHRVGITRAVRGVIDRLGIESELALIKAPTLIMVGDEDVGTVPQKAQHIHHLVQGSQLEIIKRAGHTSTLEEPEQVNQHLTTFLSQHAG